MAKIIEYKILKEVNHGTKEEPNIERTTIHAKIKCDTQASFDANYPIAEKEAIPGTIEVSGEFDPEPTPSGGDSAVWDELDEAYQKGVDSV